MSKIINNLKYVFCFCLIISIFLTIIDIYCFDSDFYKKEYAELNTAESIGVSEEDLNLMTDDLLDYLRNNKEDLSLIVNVNGHDRQAYNERETIHMADVKDLYQNVLIVRNICTLIFIIAFVLMFITKNIKGIDTAYTKNLMFFGFIFIFIGLMCLIDFDSFWISFHKMFFTKNDYWLLDPNTSLLINMVPSKFFFDLCVRIVITILIVLIGLYFAFKYLNKRLIND